MKRTFDNKLTDIKKQEQDRRTELAMLGLLIEKYAREATEKTRKVSLSIKMEIAQLKQKAFSSLY